MKLLIMETLVKLNQKQVLLDLKASDRFAALTEIIQHLVELGDIPSASAESINLALAEREENTTFAVGKNIAIPHINGTDLPECIFAYARSQEGIDFGACDSGLVHHVFLALIPEEKKCGWLKTLSRSAKALCDCDLREQLMSTTDNDEASSLLKEYLMS